MRVTARYFADGNIQRGFTLVELLVVIAIIAVLAAVIAIIINPLEVTRRSRDATRLADLEGLQKAINVTLQDSGTGSNILCAGSPPCGGVSNVGSRVTTGTGWVPINFTMQSNVNIPTLPIDPSNNDTYYYQYSSDGTDYELNAIMESEDHIPKMGEDGGDSATKYEVGTSLTILN
jgi:prepilin-type N-terminal cleavage/methylation domain-containing protein